MAEGTVRVPDMSIAMQEENDNNNNNNNDNGDDDSNDVEILMGHDDEDDDGDDSCSIKSENNTKDNHSDDDKEANHHDNEKSHTRDDNDHADDGDDDSDDGDDDNNNDNNNNDMNDSTIPQVPIPVAVGDDHPLVMRNNSHNDNGDSNNINASTNEENENNSMNYININETYTQNDENQIASNSNNDINIADNNGIMFFPGNGNNTAATDDVNNDVNNNDNNNNNNNNNEGNNGNERNYLTQGSDIPTSVWVHAQNSGTLPGEIYIQNTNNNYNNTIDPNATPWLRATTNATNPSTPLWRTNLNSCVGRVLSALTYPIMVILSIIALVLLIVICLLPAMICLFFGICVYYCLMEDPIPLSLLLRYMFYPEPEEATDYTNFFGMAQQQRPVLQSKLVIRKLITIQNNTQGENAIKTVKDYSRHDPAPISIVTDHKQLHFSEPIVFKEEEETTNKNENGNSNNNNNNNNETVPHYQRSQETPPADLDVNSIVEPIVIQETSGEISYNNNNSAQRPPNDIDIELGVPANLDEINQQSMDNVANTTSDDNGIKNNSTSPNSKGTSEQLNAESHMDEENQDIENGIVPPATASDNDDDNKDYFGVCDARDRETTCDICLLEYQEGDLVAWSPNPDCIHAFHKDCILDWLIRKQTCPICRHDYMKGKDS